MRIAIIAFVLGVWLLQQQPMLPSGRTLGLLAAVLSGLTFLCFRFSGRSRRLLACLVMLLAGFVWAALLGQLRLADALPVADEGRDLLVTGVVASLPQTFENGVRFDFDVEAAQRPIPARISLAWYRARQAADDGAGPDVHAGERWQFTVRLKRPHGNLNPHGFDYEAWLFERGIRATGYVREQAAVQRLAAFAGRPGDFIERLRESVRTRFLRALPDREYAGILVALAVGDQRAIDNGLWQLFARTGLSHLMSISGLHITMVAALAAWLTSFFWRRQPRLMLHLPAQKAAALGGWFAAFAYCLLAGFGVPAQRTLYMLTVGAFALLAGRAASASRVLALALLTVLVLDPWAVLAAGFWLSFGAVALLFYISAGRLATGHWLIAWGRAQWAITIGLLPVLLALFQQFSLVSPLANAVAIPAISLLITPLTLLAAVLPVDALLWLAHGLLSALMAYIEWLAGWPLSLWQQQAPPVWAVPLALGGCLWLLLPGGFPARWLGGIFILPLLLVEPARPGSGELRVQVLDVGQGLAVHLQTAGHDLIYDTGPQFSTDANSGNRILLPYLRAAGVRQLDGVILTHEDLDHAGGALSLIDAMPLAWTMSSLPATHPFHDAPNHRPCFDGQQWQWDGVRFEVLHPQDAAYRSAQRKSNDMSCVLKVTTAWGSVLLSGDIEARSERGLVERKGQALHADVLIAPHHGSRTSSTPEFLAAVGAKTVIFPVGYRNRFRHPHEKVWQRYEETGAQLLRTDRDGAIGIDLAVSPGLTLQREADRRYWHGQ